MRSTIVLCFVFLQGFTFARDAKVENANVTLVEVLGYCPNTNKDTVFELEATLDHVLAIRDDILESLKADGVTPDSDLRQTLLRLRIARTPESEWKGSFIKRSIHDRCMAEYARDSRRLVLLTSSLK